ncbi:MAG: cell division protein FtsH [Candidatus Magasanikbacteria bacterium RIFCSPHIGHO2_01_FULL_50_8]|uniref:ATP-dependent zinc metalloprotease FtsH n=2 Tax=Candidatus Magasanikiibacteriota TaxID=1752731 RepID=A0A1F6LNP8_9BACT|nr:MAG: cell division protein FtsH [Candidatus Magasanikbacteria bacterium RIFCSPHIGHO2_01_FULL_50_8]OGH67474.1 MAG: cell division protein FtsH [Candidatus Magasanikbacteria bacterium RIFCSPHIGHO2_02_FULL_50_9b]
MRPFIKNIGIFIGAMVLLALIANVVRTSKEEVRTVSLSELATSIQQKSVKKIEVMNSDLAITATDGKKMVSRKEVGESLPTVLRTYGVTPEQLQSVELAVVGETGWRYWVGVLVPVFGPIILIVALFYFMARQVQGANSRAMGFGQSVAKEVAADQKVKVTFADVAGMKESKEELQEVVEFLKTAEKFTGMGAKIPKGVLLMGPPGTGKTLLARAVAGEAGVPFLHMSGSEFVEMFVGVGASRVRDLFARAKKLAPAIVFIDEIDAVGRRRGSGMGGSHDEREQTLNQILVEMDGFEANSGIIVIAATNRADVLDPALLRPGRFDRRVTVTYPDINEREAILGIHAKNKPLDPEISLRNIGERTPGFTGADLANLMNEAAILAVRRVKKTIGLIEILESIDKVLLGPERRSHVFSQDEKKMTAYHEGGHALVSHLLKHTDPIRKVSIISRGHAGGYTLKMPIEDKHYHTRAEFVDDLAMALGGWAAEKLIFGDDMVSTGPSSDLRTATRIARDAVTQYGMSDALGPRTFGTREELMYVGQGMPERDYSEKTSELIDAEVSRLVKAAGDQATRLLGKHRATLDKIANELLVKETLEEKEFVELVGIEKGAETI